MTNKDLPLSIKALEDGKPHWVSEIDINTIPFPDTRNDVLAQKKLLRLGETPESIRMKFVFSTVWYLQVLAIDHSKMQLLLKKAHCKLREEIQLRQQKERLWFNDVWYGRDTKTHKKLPEPVLEPQEPRTMGFWETVGWILWH